LTNRRSANSILFLTAFSVVVVGTAAHAFAQTDTSIPINIRPLKDFGAVAKEQIISGRVDLNAPFVLELRGKLVNGKLDPSTTRTGRSEGDPGMLKLAKGYVAALDGSGYLQYFSLVGASDVTVFAKQDDSSFKAAISFDTKSEERARTVSLLLGAMINMAGEKENRTELSENEKKELVLVSAMKASTVEKNVALSLDLAKTAFRQLVEDELKRH